MEDGLEQEQLDEKLVVRNSLFTVDERFTNEALTIYSQLYGQMKSLLKKHDKYPVREVSHLIQITLTDAIAELLQQRRRGRIK